ncbi:hypothetical protein JTE90_026063 [Oedothorax gibbosus]|uniref:BPTI/Kunitz inhibitor domain-containing protein n=1 Tax=Oedothorax gibbosus TaxID=931172 RepID=A0AAV6UC21_9ARAC|nr:hypothetical protein JTE90_026063 [Oedothorax gibbosus]
MKILIFSCIIAVALAAWPEEKKTCTDKPDTGLCQALFRMWYYDPETQSCQRFVYGGCQGNGNRYWSEEECLNNCKGVEPVSMQHGEDEEVDCNSFPDVGLCDALIQRYYYNPLEGECQQFTYGGCGGNGNNFKTEEECNNKCANSDDALSAIPMPFSCDCEGEDSTCACCGHMKISTIRLDKKVCIEVGYNNEKKALSLNIKAGDKVLYNNSISATNPPPVCIGIPPMTMFADVCFDFYDIKVNTEEIHFCLNVKPRLVKKNVADWKVGCNNLKRKVIEEQQ